MGYKIIGAIAAFLLVSSRLFSYPVLADEVISVQTGQTIARINNLKLTNNISIHASTGDNQLSGNDGDVTVNTGNVNIAASIKNSLNNSENSISKPNATDNIRIQENGEDSLNSIEEDISLLEEELSVNNLELNNNISSDLNTGGNKTVKNSGKVFISTGDIYLSIILGNRVSNSAVAATSYYLKNLFEVINPI